MPCERTQVGCSVSAKDSSNCAQLVEKFEPVTRPSLDDTTLPTEPEEDSGDEGVLHSD